MDTQMFLMQRMFMRADMGSVKLRKNGELVGKVTGELIG
jgi:hypothetical protein